MEAKIEPRMVRGRGLSVGKVSGLQKPESVGWKLVCARPETSPAWRRAARRCAGVSSPAVARATEPRRLGLFQFVPTTTRIGRFGGKAAPAGGNGPVRPWAYTKPLLRDGGQPSREFRPRSCLASHACLAVLEQGRRGLFQALRWLAGEGESAPFVEFL